MTPQTRQNIPAIRTPTRPRAIAAHKFWLIGSLTWTLLALTISPAAADTVAQRRVPQQTMLLHDMHHTGLSPHQGPQRGQILWRTHISGDVLAAAAVDVDGNSYWTTRAGQLHVLTPDGAPRVHIELGGPSHSSPAIDAQGNVYTATRDGRLIALRSDGQLIWSRDTNREILSSPLLDERSDLMVISVEDRTLGLEMSSGRLRFVYNANNRRNNSSPVMGPDGLVRVVNWDGQVLAISGLGRRVWRTELSRAASWTSPTLGSFGTLYTASADGSLVALSPAGRILWVHSINKNVSGFLALLPDGRILTPVMTGIYATTLDGQESWFHRLPGGDSINASLAVSRDGDVLAGTLGGRIISIDHQGETNWTIEPEVFSNPQSFRSPVIIPAPVRGIPRAYLGSRDGDVFCIE